MVTPPEFRRIMGRLATGVTVVATVDPDTGAPQGLTASAVASVSLAPPLVLACVERGADTHACLLESGVFSISVLREGQERVSRQFAREDGGDKFDGIAYREEVTGAPVLEHTLAWVDCETWATYEGGDHTIFVGRVVAGDAFEGAPLLYFRSGYGRLRP